VPKDLDWIDENSILSYAEQGNTSNTAQVHPFLFTNAMAELAVESGAEIILGRATAIDYTGTHGVKGVTYEAKETGDIKTLHATEVVLAAGPWTTHIWPSLEMNAMRVHSVVVEAEVTPYALFTEIQLPKGWASSKNKKTAAPELYARPDGTVYACGSFLLFSFRPFSPFSSGSAVTDHYIYYRRRRYTRPPPQNGWTRPR